MTPNISGSMLVVTASAKVAWGPEVLYGACRESSLLSQKPQQIRHAMQPHEPSITAHTSTHQLGLCSVDNHGILGAGRLQVCAREAGIQHGLGVRNQRANLTGCSACCEGPQGPPTAEPQAPPPTPPAMALTMSSRKPPAAALHPASPSKHLQATGVPGPTRRNPPFSKKKGTSFQWHRLCAVQVQVIGYKHLTLNTNPSSTTTFGMKQPCPHNASRVV